MRYIDGDQPKLYPDGHRLRFDARRVGKGVSLDQSQESLSEQIKDVHALATSFGLYDAADWLKDLLGHRERYTADYGEPPPDA